MKNYRFIFLTVLVTVMVGLLTSIKYSTASAASIDSNSYITDASLSDKTHPGATEYGLYDDLEANWRFHLPQNVNIKSGDTIVVSIPQQMAVPGDLNFPIKDDSGNIVGNAHADASNNKVTITFTNFTENTLKISDINGTMMLSLRWNVSTVKANANNVIDWSYNGKTSNIFITGDSLPDDNERIYKWGWYDANDPSIIHWQVRVNYSKSNIKNAVYTDTIGPNQELVKGSIKPYNIAYIPGTDNYNTGSLIDISKVFEDSSTAFHINFGDIDSTYMVKYSTKITDNISSNSYENTVNLKGDNITPTQLSVYSPTLNGGGAANYTEKTNTLESKTGNDHNNQNSDNITNPHISESKPNSENNIETPKNVIKSAIKSGLPDTGKKSGKDTIVLLILSVLVSIGLISITRK